MPDLSDAELVARLQKREAESAGILVEQYADRLYNYAYYRSNDHHMAEDIVSETFIRIIEKVGGYEQRDIPFKAWVFRIAHNQLINHLRQRNRYRTVPLEVIHWDTEPAYASSGDWGAADGGDLAAYIAERDELQQAIATLEGDQRSVFILRFIEGFELEQVALMLEKSVVSIKSLQYRAVRNLRRVLEPVGRGSRAEGYTRSSNSSGVGNF